MDPQNTSIQERKKAGGDVDAKNAVTDDGQRPVGDKENVNYDSVLKNPKSRVILITSCTVFLFSIVLIVILITLLSEDDDWLVDKYPRYLKLLPTPNAPRNTIRFTHGHRYEGKVWPQLTDELKSFLVLYDPKYTLTGFKNITHCGKNRPPEGQVCHWDTDSIQSLCKASNEFGYPEGDPCVFLQLRHILHFQVEPYTPEDIKTNPLLTKDGRTNYRIRQSYLFIECKGNTIVDVENSGKIIYAPSSQEFPEQFFPYTGHPDYMFPFVAVKFEKPRKNIVIGITCRLWAKNLTHDNGYSPSELPFNLFIE